MTILVDIYQQNIDKDFVIDGSSERTKRKFTFISEQARDAKIISSRHLANDFEHRLLVKSMHKKVHKGTDSGCLDNQYRRRP